MRLISQCPTKSAERENSDDDDDDDDDHTDVDDDCGGGGEMKQCRALAVVCRRE